MLAIFRQQTLKIMINAKLLVVWASALPLISSFAQEITQAGIRELEALTREALTASPTEGPDGALQGWVDTLNPLNFTNQLYQIWGNNEKLKKGYIDRGLLFEPHTKFTPETWTANKWLDPNSSFMRVVGVAILVVFFQVGANYDFTRNIPTTRETLLGHV